MKHLLISFSGGLTSRFMVRYLLESPKYKDYKKHIVFANTGLESDATLDFINEVDKEELGGQVIWLEAYARTKGNGHSVSIVSYDTSHRQKDIYKDSHPFARHIKKNGAPSTRVRHCTRDLKQRAIDKYMSDVSGYWVKAIGIRADEKRPMPRKREKGMPIIYPLSDDVACDKNMINSWSERQAVKLKNKGDHEGNCGAGCFLISYRKRATAIKQGLFHPLALKWLNDWEHMTGQVFDRAGKYTFEMLIILGNDEDFEDYSDKKTQLDYTLDSEISCFCGT